MRRRRTRYEPRPQLPVYRRQPFPATLVGEDVRYGETIFETDGVRLLAHRRRHRDRLASSRACTRSAATCSKACMRALDEAERNWMGLVIWQTEPPFSVGANLKKTAAAAASAQPAFGARQALQDGAARSRVARAQGRAPDRRRRPVDGGTARRSRAAPRASSRRRRRRSSSRWCRPSRRSTASRSAAAASSSCIATARSRRSKATSASSKSASGCCPAAGGCKEFALRAAADAKGGDIEPVHPALFPHRRDGGGRRAAPSTRKSSAICGPPTRS